MLHVCLCNDVLCSREYRLILYKLPSITSLGNTLLIHIASIHVYQTNCLILSMRYTDTITYYMYAYLHPSDNS